MSQNWIKSKITQAKLRDSSALPLNARLLWEMVLETVNTGSYSRILEDSYQTCAEVDSLLNVDEIEPYFDQMTHWMDGMEIPDETEICHRRMKAHSLAGYVYVFERNDGIHKIGFSKNPTKRIKQLKWKHGLLLQRLAFAGNRVTEILVQSLFKRKRVKVENEIEWFRLEHEDLVRLAGLCKASALL